MGDIHCEVVTVLTWLVIELLQICISARSALTISMVRCTVATQKLWDVSLFWYVTFVSVLIYNVYAKYIDRRLWCAYMRSFLRIVFDLCGMCNRFLVFIQRLTHNSGSITYVIGLLIEQSMNIYICWVHCASQCEQFYIQYRVVAIVIVNRSMKLYYSHVTIFVLVLHRLVVYMPSVV
jgi:hypothetical protein